ncbi:tetratricopeptide (TPR) repeat protein [Lewinella aquimaris]|uniref:Tetratricopeptide (TPR) repeat protein n=1 Tax=Neolewinella aquimaris TaxID=1835722 RepID=A0A840EE52_9BACT|nr:caspase family protein [Neolewinella aquimaris]MBB4080079.1 tetratricopeptide (TPR) repeat protein [Neolewinella aquimaris]
MSPLIGAGQATAVVIGIADFQDPGITDLRYADDDARAFAEFLFSPMGADLPRDRVRLLTDTSATLAAIQSALAWQLSMAAEGQTAYLYLATHGDVEATDLQSSGFLLAHDTPRSNYDLLALSVSFLNDHLAALSEKHVMPVVVTDACHAGTLAGDAVAGRRLTAASLMQRQGTEVRMLACQPYELSHEGERWGGGRGAFSYHLLEGMRGAADEDRNRQIDLFELERYVQNRVSEDTDREQHPELFGDRKDLSLFTVASESQSTFQRESTQRLEVSFEESTVALAPPEAQRDYLRFRRALSAGALLMPEEQSALAYYRKLRSAPALLPLRGLLDERLTVALLDAVQQAIVAYLDSDPEELTARDRIDEKYRVFPLYLSTAAAILGPEDPRIPGIRAKEAYFRGMVLRLEADWNGRTDSSYHQALDQLESAVALQPEAAYLHNERGLILMRLANAEAAYGSFIEATRLAPTWALPYSNLGILLKQQNARANYQLAADYFDRAIALKPDLAGAYMNYGNLLYDTGRTDSAEILLRQALDLKPSDTYARYNLALLIGEDPAGRRDAQRIYAAIIEENQALVADSHLESGRIYLDMNLLDSAEHHLKQAIALQPTDRNAYALLRRAYLADGREEVSAAYFSELIATRPDRPFGYYNLAMTDTLSSDWLRQLRNASLPDSVFYELATTLGFSFYWEGRYLQAEESLKLATRSTQYGPAARFNLSAFLAATGQEKKTLAAVREALRLADNPEAVTLYCRRFAADADFEKLRSTEGFQKLYDKHCGGLPPPD